MKRVLPHSVEAEQSVIGSMLMDKDAIIAASEIITAADFYQQQYGVMFECMVELFNEGAPVDLITLQNRLKEKDVPPEVSSLEFVRDIITTVPTSANDRSYANIVYEKSRSMRRLLTPVTPVRSRWNRFWQEPKRRFSTFSRTEIPVILCRSARWH